MDHARAGLRSEIVISKEEEEVLAAALVGQPEISSAGAVNLRRENRRRCELITAWASTRDRRCGGSGFRPVTDSRSTASELGGDGACCAVELGKFTNELPREMLASAEHAGISEHARALLL